MIDFDEVEKGLVGFLGAYLEKKERIEKDLTVLTMDIHRTQGAIDLIRKLRIQQKEGVTNE
jgi:hypothetical protein